MNNLVGLLAALALVGAVGGCASSKPYQASFDVPTLSVRGETDIVIQGVQIGVAPITRDNVSKFPQLARPATWRQPDPAAPPAIGSEGRAVPSGKTIQHGAVIELVPLPAFFVGIANETGKPLSLSGTKIEVEDSAHRPYSVVLNPEALRERFFGDITGTNPFVAGDHTLMGRLMEQIVNLPLLNTSVVIPDGEVWKGYLVMDVNTRSSREYYSLMKSIQSFTVRLKGVPTSGGPSDFVFAVDKAERKTMLTCPGEVADPAPERCTAAQAGS